MHPRHWDRLLGARAVHDIPADTGIHPDDVASFDPASED
jgi:sialic acid synthase SpsE